ncbi:MAG: hypothetical protein J0L77_08420 [Alphaproteobacteria bacterium]|nr:hypothetical protein [Alphaproteobacteria bacterium]
MKATFRNKFRIINAMEGERVIRYHHPYRLDLEILLAPRTDKNDLLPMDWGITLKTRNRTLVKQLRGELAEDILGYIFKRSREDIRKLSYDDLVEMANMWSIH